MTITQSRKKLIVGALLSGGVALGVGLTAGTANAMPTPHPALTIEHSDFAVPGDGSVRATNPEARACDGSVRVAAPAARLCDGSVRVITPAP